MASVKVMLLWLWSNSSYSYSDLRQPSAKLIGGIENQRYTLDISGKLTAINRDFVYGSTTQDATFGVDICTDHGFTQKRYDGQLSGIIWRGAASRTGDRSYGYSYDAAGRLTGADFFEERLLVPVGAPAWHRDETDYSVSGISYDANGNMLTMSQRGMGMQNGRIQPIPLSFPARYS